MSHERLLQLFDRMEGERQVLLKKLDAVPPARLTQRPTNGGWSVAQVMTHLAIAEEGSLAYLNKKREFNKHGPVGFSASLRLLVLNTGIQLPVKYKAPLVIADVPATSYAVARTRWDTVRIRMRSTYQELPEALAGHDLFKHPFMGRFNLVQAVGFMCRHMRRHVAQIDRTLTALG